jgi:hypothetical protein
MVRCLVEVVESSGSGHLHTRRGENHLTRAYREVRPIDRHNPNHIWPSTFHCPTQNQQNFSPGWRRPNLSANYDSDNDYSNMLEKRRGSFGRLLVAQSNIGSSSASSGGAATSVATNMVSIPIDFRDSDDSADQSLAIEPATAGAGAGATDPYDHRKSLRSLSSTASDHSSHRYLPPPPHNHCSFHDNDNHSAGVGTAERLGRIEPLLLVTPSSSHYPSGHDAHKKMTDPVSKQHCRRPQQQQLQQLQQLQQQQKTHSNLNSSNRSLSHERRENNQLASSSGHHRYRLYPTRAGSRTKRGQDKAGGGGGGPSFQSQRTISTATTATSTSYIDPWLTKVEPPTCDGGGQFLPQQPQHHHHQPSLRSASDHASRKLSHRQLSLSCTSDHIPSPQRPTCSNNARSDREERQHLLQQEQLQPHLHLQCIKAVHGGNYNDSANSGLSMSSSDFWDNDDDNDNNKNGAYDDTYDLSSGDGYHDEDGNDRRYEEPTTCAAGRNCDHPYEDDYHMSLLPSPSPSLCRTITLHESSEDEKLPALRRRPTLRQQSSGGKSWETSSVSLRELSYTTEDEKLPVLRCRPPLRQKSSGGKSWESSSSVQFDVSLSQMSFSTEDEKFPALRCRPPLRQQSSGGKSWESSSSAQFDVSLSQLSFALEDEKLPALHRRLPLRRQSSGGKSWEGSSSAQFDVSLLQLSFTHERELSFRSAIGSTSTVHDHTPCTKTDTKKTSTTNVEIAPGVYKPLRGADRTLEAIRANAILPTVCIPCDLHILTLANVKYVICPQCRTVSGTADPHDDTGATTTAGTEDDAVGLGFAFDELDQWQTKGVITRAMAA